MKLNEQIVSLELAKRLKELGVEQESLFMWNQQGDLEYTDPKTWVGYTTDTSAFTVAELGEMLPMIYFPVPDKGNGCLSWLWVDGKGNKTWENTEADARAKMLIYLLENKLIEKDSK